MRMSILLVFAITTSAWASGGSSKPDKEKASSEGTRIDLFEDIDLEDALLSGAWEETDNGLQTNDAEPARLDLGKAPKGEYDFTITFTRLNGNRAVGQALSYRKHDFGWFMGGVRPGAGESHNGFAEVDDSPSWNNRSTVDKDIIRNGVKHSAVVKVRKGSVEAWIDDAQIVKLKTNYKDLAPAGRSAVTPGHLGLVSWESPTIFHSAELVVLSKKSKKKSRSKKKIAPNQEPPQSRGRPGDRKKSAPFAPDKMWTGIWSVDTGPLNISGTVESHNGNKVVFRLTTKEFGTRDWVFQIDGANCKLVDSLIVKVKFGNQVSNIRGEGGYRDGHLDWRGGWLITGRNGKSNRVNNTRIVLTRQD